MFGLVAAILSSGAAEVGGACWTPPCVCPPGEEERHKVEAAAVHVPSVDVFNGAPLMFWPCRNSQVAVTFLIS